VWQVSGSFATWAAFEGGKRVDLLSLPDYAPIGRCAGSTAIGSGSLGGHFMQLSTIAIAAVLASSTGWTPNCIAELSDFDFYSTSPQNSYFGARKNVSRAYDLLAEEIGNPERYDKPTVFYVTHDFSRFSSSECPGEKCSGRDIFAGMQQCARATGLLCHPIAAVYQSQMYCLLQPSLEEFDYYNPFRPYE
jgi:hypothetical protein